MNALEKRSPISLDGRVLWLSEDADQVRRQFRGLDLAFDDSRSLLDNISTDEIIPAWACYYYDETIARYCLTGLRGGVVQDGQVLKGHFRVVVSGASKGCGSSREQAPLSEYMAGVRVVFARSFEKIYAQNAQNIGLLLSTDFSLLEKLMAGEPVPRDAFTRGLDDLSAEVVRHGGLFPFSLSHHGASTVATAGAGARPMTLVEKIMARHAQVGHVTPGQSLLLPVDVRFSHEYVTAMSDSLLRAHDGGDRKLVDPSSIYLFRDHLTLLDEVMSDTHRRMGLAEQAAGLARGQEAFARRFGLDILGELTRDGKVIGSESICHNAVVDDIALPGQVVVGTDSHTCTAGSIGAFAFGVGATDMAVAWVTGRVRVRVPETVKIVLRGRCRPGVMAKDVVLHVLATSWCRQGALVGKVVQWAGPGLREFGLDERATLANMSVEGGAFTGLMAMDEPVAEELAKRRGLSVGEVMVNAPVEDEGAHFSKVYEVNLGDVPVTVALPGNPKNGVSVDELEGAWGGPVQIDIAYGGSCTGGKRSDMDAYATVLGEALERGQRVADGVQLYIQFGSQAVKRYAQRRGYLDVFEQAGAKVLEPSCGACILAGPGISTSPDQVTVSAVNRNYPGRSGPGRVLLASPLVVAASAVAGRILAPALARVQGAG